MTKSNAKHGGIASSIRRILVVDDHPLMRMALRSVVEARAGWVCCGEADDPESTLAGLQKHSPDLVLLDFYLKSGDGIDLIKEIRQRWDSLRILIISRFSDPELAERSLRAGADGYVIKEETADQVVLAIEQTLEGENFISQTISGQVVKRMLGGRGAPDGDLSNLSDREFQVLQFLGQGFSNKEIAEMLHLSPKTIGTYREHLKEKLGLKDSQQLIQYAARRFDGVSVHATANRPKKPRRGSSGARLS